MSDNKQDILVLPLSRCHIGSNGLPLEDGKVAIRKDAVNIVATDNSGCVISGYCITQSFEDVLKQLGWD